MQAAKKLVVPGSIHNWPDPIIVCSAQPVGCAESPLYLVPGCHGYMMDTLVTD